VRLPWLPLLPWQLDAARAVLARRASWPHALLVHGPRGIGKHALALNLAQALLCEAPRADSLACGECAGCRYAIAGQHPDFMRLELLVVDPEEGILATVETISIDRVRALTEFVQLTSHRQRRSPSRRADGTRRRQRAAEDARGAARDVPDPRLGPAGARARDHCFALSRSSRRCPRRRGAWLAAQGASPTCARTGGGVLIARSRVGSQVQTERRPLGTGA
jgi:hypothetical protein